MANDKPKAGNINYGWGELNQVQMPDIYEVYDPATTSGVDTLRNLCNKNFTIDTLASPGGFKAICLQVDFLTQANAAGSWISSVFGPEGDAEILLAVTARIPELHSMLPKPFSKKGGQTILDMKITKMHPTFIAVDTNASDDPPAPGDIVNVDFSNRINMSGPIYLGKILSSPVMFDIEVSSAGAFRKNAGSLQSGTSENLRWQYKDETPRALRKSPAQYTTDEKLESLNSNFRQKIVRVIKALTRRGFQPELFFAYRTLAEQKRLFLQGRSKLLFSFYTATKNGKPNSYAAAIIDQRWAWDGGTTVERDEFWNALGEEAKRAGLFWGGDWKNFKNVAHLQYYPSTMLSQVRRESS